MNFGISIASIYAVFTNRSEQAVLCSKSPGMRAIQHICFAERFSDFDRHEGIKYVYEKYLCKIRKLCDQGSEDSGGKL
jgi:hypothetical protein